MKKIFFFSLLLIPVVLFQFCSASKKAQKSAPAITYSGEVQNIVASSCAPCHMGPNAKQKRLDSYAAVENNISEIIRRIQLNPGEKGFMPFKRDKLADSTIQVFVHWKDNGMKP